MSITALLLFTVLLGVSICVFVFFFGALRSCTVACVELVSCIVLRRFLCVARCIFQKFLLFAVAATFCANFGSTVSYTRTTPHAAAFAARRAALVAFCKILDFFSRLLRRHWSPPARAAAVPLFGRSFALHAHTTAPRCVLQRSDRKNCFAALRSRTRCQSAVLLHHWLRGQCMAQHSTVSGRPSSVFVAFFRFA